MDEHIQIDVYFGLNNLNSVLLVWMIKSQLKPGQNYKNNIKNNKIWTCTECNRKGNFYENNPLF